LLALLLQLSVVDGDSYNDNEPSSSRPRELLKGDDVSVQLARGGAVEAAQDAVTHNSSSVSATLCCLLHSSDRCKAVYIAEGTS
jgi:hypothetical protein